MQGPQDNFFFHPNQRFGGDGGLEDERQLLVEEQKFCRARARKFSLETKRRRKALEERQKQWDVQEQRLRENILQQRRQQVQDATERFQRAHLPPSQRRRQFFRRNVPNIDDALNQLQGSLSFFIRQSSVLCSTSNISRSCTPSPKPPTVSKPSHHQGLSAVEAYTKLLQEQSMTIFKNSQETEKSQEKLQDHSLQDSHLSDCCNSESLSSKDSLENEDLNHSTNNFYSSFLLDSEKPHLNLGKQNYLIPTSQLTSSGMMLVGDNLNQSQKLHELKQKKQEDYEGSNNKMYVSKDSWGFASGQMLKTETQTTEDNCNFLSSCGITGSDLDHFEVNYPQNCVNNNIVTHKVTSGTAFESLCPKQEALLDPKHQRVHDDKHPSATEILFPAKNSKDILSWAPQKPNIFLNDSTTDNVSQEQTLQQTGKENFFLSSKKEPSASINNLNKVSQSESKTVKSISTAMLQHTSLSNIQSDTLKCLKCPEEDVQKFPVSEEASHSVCEVRFIKGILKKPSKYMSGDTACVYGSGQLIFAKQVALEIRDSIELTKVKAKDMEGNAIKKKLRWFDEVHVGKEDKAKNTMKQMKGKFVNLSQSKKNPEDHQLSLATVSGACRPGPSMTPPATTGYHFTKQAWADVGVQVSPPQRQADEVKVPRSSTRTGGPKVPWRERSARAGAGPVSSRTRKGTVIRPQSAIEVNQIAKPQGKMMVPCPPPRIDSLDEKTAYITKTLQGMDHASVNCKQAPATEQALHKITSEGFFSPYTHHLIGTDSAVVYTPLPPSYTCPVSATSGHQEAPGCSRRKGMVLNEKALCLDCTPTDEEISKLWHGVRSALATKDEKNILKRQTLESGRVFRKHYTEQSRQSSGSGNRRLPQPSQPTKQLTEPVKIFSNTCNMAFTDEALDGAARLHLAEVHTPGLLEGRDIVAAMETTQTQSPGTVQQCSKQQGLTSISLEEQKILLSLDRLNQQLRRVREHVGSNNGTPGLVLIDAPSTKEIKVTNHLKHNASSANNRSRYLKKF